MNVDFLLRLITEVNNVCLVYVTVVTFLLEEHRNLAA